MYSIFLWVIPLACLSQAQLVIYYLTRFTPGSIDTKFRVIWTEASQTGNQAWWGNHFKLTANWSSGGGGCLQLLWWGHLSLTRQFMQWVSGSLCSGHSIRARWVRDNQGGQRYWKLMSKGLKVLPRLTEFKTEGIRAAGKMSGGWDEDPEREAAEGELAGVGYSPPHGGRGQTEKRSLT